MPIESQSQSRIRLKDIAKAAHVHLSTVSLALRGSPRLPIETLERIQKIAEEMGYRPDPNLNAFNHRRSVHANSKSLPSFAFITDSSPNIENEDDGTAWFFKSLKKECEESGIALEAFQVGNNNLPFHRLNQILKSRNINAAIVWLHDIVSDNSVLDWDRFCCLKIETLHTLDVIDAICPNYRRGTRMAVNELAKLGAKRIGLAIDQHTRKRLDALHEIGYYLEICEHPELANIPLCSWRTGNSDHETLEQVKEWTNKFSLDAVISPHNQLLRGLKKQRNNLHVGSLQRSPNEPLPGIELLTSDLSHIVTQHLTTLIQSNQKGVSSTPSVKLTPVSWHL